MHMPNEQDRFEFAQSERLHEASVFGRPLYILVLCRFFVQRVFNVSAVHIVSSGKIIGNIHKLVFALAPEIS
jgi:hypothetical protein